MGEVSAHCVEAVAKELDADEDLSLEVRSHRSDVKRWKSDGKVMKMVKTVFA